LDYAEGVDPEVPLTELLAEEDGVFDGIWEAGELFE
jgi:hypothetical protein